MSERLKINDIFLSIQGEGQYVGTPMVFIRFAGCNLSCSWCDTDKYEHYCMTAEQVFNYIKTLCNYPSSIPVCLTGGEPLLQWGLAMEELANRLIEKGSGLHLETNGLLLDGEIGLGVFDYVTVSPKPPSSGCETLDYWDSLALSRADEFKVVIADQEDYNWVVQNACWFVDRPLFLQPCDGRSSFSDLWEMWQKNPIPCRILPQVHKLVGVK